MQKYSHAISTILGLWCQPETHSPTGRKHETCTHPHSRGWQPSCHQMQRANYTSCITHTHAQRTHTSMTCMQRQSKLHESIMSGSHLKKVFTMVKRPFFRTNSTNNHHILMEELFSAYDRQELTSHPSPPPIRQVGCTCLSCLHHNTRMLTLHAQP